MNHTFRYTLVGFLIGLITLTTLSAQQVQSNHVRVLFAGDVSFGENYQIKREKSGKPNILKVKGYDYCFEKVDPLLKSAQVVISNLEAPITDIPTSPFTGKKTYIHYTDVVKAPLYLYKHHLTVFTLANNHMLDYGPQGLLQTMDILAKNKMSFFGAGKDEAAASAPYQHKVVLGAKSLNIIVLGGMEFQKKYDTLYHFYATNNKPGIKNWSEKNATDQIKKVRTANPDAFIIMFPHWGDNYQWKNTSQTRLGHSMIDAGADMIIGHGAHMIQEVEIYKGKRILYNIGNLVFNSDGRYQKEKNATPYSFAVGMDIAEGKSGPTMEIRLYPIFGDNLITQFQPRLVTSQEIQKVLELLIAHSNDAVQLKKELQPKEDETGWYLSTTPQPLSMP